MTTSASGASPRRTPHANAASEAGVVPTVAIRQERRAKILAGPPNGMRADSIYVRRFWVAAIGPGAVADMLRIISAARHKTTVKHPIYLHVLVTSGLAAFDGKTITVADPVPPLPAHLVRRLPPPLRREHATWMRLRRTRGQG